MNQHQEFDPFAKVYRQKQTQYLAATGYDSHYFATLKANKLKEWLPTYLGYEPITILDFGCGDGVMVKEVQHVYPTAKLYGVDPSSESIAVAQQNLPKATFLISGESLSMLEDAMFDVIYAAGVFHHIPFEQHEQYIQEFYRILKPQGVMVLFELNPLNLGTRYIFKNNPLEFDAKMLMPWYAKKLVGRGYITTLYYCFYPKFLRSLGWTENYLTKVPLGGLYGTIAKKL